MIGKRIHVTGVVQGVGFRPFVYSLALRHDLRGQVRNTSSGVDIQIEGEPDQVSSFIQALTVEAPPLARIDSVEVADASPNGFTAFEIAESVAQAGAFQPISPDIALCADCARELFDPADRRYLYPFINCTNCGPRFTIIRDLPYDRPATTMAPFEMCPDCAREYRDPLDRRFHAQPVACPRCGPHVWIEQSAISDQRSAIGNEQPATSNQPQVILEARRLLRSGAILAVKGLGGFHLACDATNARAVAELRRRKGRVGKPFAIMLADLATVQEFCQVDDAEQALLTGREKPIVLLTHRTGSPIAVEVAPGVDTLGVMLPYAPLHHLLINQTDPVLAAEPAPRALVMTSGNYSEEPIATDNDEALTRLATLADVFLLHNRDIYLRCDDSVARVPHPTSNLQPPISNTQSLVSTTLRAPLFLRRSRGYAPYPVHLPFDAPPILAVGGELKNTFCLTRERYAFMSQHIGDMENAETLASFEQSVKHLTRLFRIEPAIIAHDLHPNYLSTQYTNRITQSLTPNLQSPIPVPIQHHHAHIASVMAEHELSGDEPVIGLAFDGTGYGTDGAIWGGEFLVANYQDFRRAAHLEYLPLPGGDAAIRKPWRIALGYATALGLDVSGLPFLREVDPRAAQVVQSQVKKQLNAPNTSSMGRLFDAVAALANVRGEVSYEAQAAIELETAALADSASDIYLYRLELVERVLLIRLAELLGAVIGDVRRGEPASAISARFHRTVAAFSVDICRRLRAEIGLNNVALSGGVWQNVTLLGLALEALQGEGFTVYTHQIVPPNDGGLALGQAAIAAHTAR